jgi:hypothetical protein
VLEGRSRWIDGFFGDMDFLPMCGLEARRVDGGLDVRSFAVAGLESGSVLTLCYVNVGIVLSAVWMSVNLNVDVFVVVGWEIDVDVCARVSAFRSDEENISR